MTTSQWTDRFGVFVYGEQVLLPHRIQFKPEKVDFERGSETWLMVRALQSRSNDGFLRQRAVRDLLTDIRPWTAPFVVALIGEYIAEILIDIDAAMLPGSVAVITEFISAGCKLSQPNTKCCQCILREALVGGSGPLPGRCGSVC